MAHTPQITNRLADALRASGLTQAELARAVGLTRGSVNAWMQGRSQHIRAEHLFAVADTLGVEARWLATGKGPRDRQVLSQAAAELIADYQALDDDAKAAVRLLARQIAESKGRYS